MSPSGRQQRVRFGSKHLGSQQPEILKVLVLGSAMNSGCLSCAGQKAGLGHVHGGVLSFSEVITVIGPELHPKHRCGINFVSFAVWGSRSNGVVSKSKTKEALPSSSHV